MKTWPAVLLMSLALAVQARGQSPVMMELVTAAEKFSEILHSNPRNYRLATARALRTFDPSPARARELLDQALELARRDSGLREEVRRILGPRWDSFYQNVSNELHREAAAAEKLPPVHSDRSPFPSAPGVAVSKWVFVRAQPIEIQSLHADGVDGTLVDYLLRSHLVDSTCTSLLTPECRLSVVRLSQLQTAGIKRGNRVEFVLDDPDDFIRTYNALSRSQDEEPDSQNRDPKPAAGQSPKPIHKACESEFKVCIAPDSASMVLGCEGLGEIEIATNAHISLSMAIKPKKFGGASKE